MAKKKKKTTKTDKKKSNKVVPISRTNLLDKVAEAGDLPIVVSVPGFKHATVTDVFPDKDRIILTTYPMSSDNELLNAARAIRKEWYEAYPDQVVEDVSQIMANLFKAIENYDGRDPK